MGVFMFQLLNLSNRAWLWCLLLASPLVLAQSWQEEIAAFQLPAPEQGRLSKPMYLWATYYSLPVLKAKRRGYALLDRHGRIVGPRLSRRDWCRAALEGSLQVVASGRSTVFNFDGTGVARQVNCASRYTGLPGSVARALGRSRFRRAVGRFGDGVNNYRLMPFRSMAVDPGRIPYGSVIYIPEARGVTFAWRGKRYSHDGYFFAADTGGAIKNRHVDIHIGTARHNPFSFVKSRSRPRFKAHRVWHSQLKHQMVTRHTGS